MPDLGTVLPPAVPDDNRNARTQVTFLDVHPNCGHILACAVRESTALGYYDLEEYYTYHILRWTLCLSLQHHPVPSSGF